jgi:hypothetical protein
VESRRLRRLVGRDLHGEEAIVGPVFAVERAVAAADDDLEFIPSQPKSNSFL